MIYVLVFAALILVSVAGKRWLYWPVLVGLFLFAAFRFEVGCDWTGYLNQFYVHGVSDFGDALEGNDPLWVSLFIAQADLGLAYPWINVVSALVFFGGIHLVARRQPDPLAYLILLFPVLIINMPMSGIRQAMAIGIMCGAYVAFIDRRTVRFVIIVLLASSIHSSAIVFLLLAPLVSGDITQRRVITTALLAVPGLAIVWMAGNAETATTRYVDTDIDAAGALFRVGLVALTGIAFLLFLRQRWQTLPDDSYRLVLLGSQMMLALLAMLPLSSVIADRLSYYLVPIQTMILAGLPFLPFHSHRRTIAAAPYVALFVMLIVWTALSRHFNDCYLPYQTWLGGMPPASRMLY
ncbi:EpsG family protein [Croceicoccus bisphenolivorans]|uniref:EpsG family protein n=1 Tax=Croceicoccus bisphenolivorans TaxID=1783232 RepID=UPI00082A83F1|nr:EpsG family protein [Croceicoccus bisphenolivorans]